MELRGQSFIWDRNCVRPQAIYPNVDVTSNDASAISGLILLDLAPDGVYQATRVTPRPGGLLPHRFTLTHGVTSCWRFAFCCTFPSLAAGRRYRPSCSMEPGLSSEVPTATRLHLGDCPASRILSSIHTIDQRFIRPAHPCAKYHPLRSAEQLHGSIALVLLLVLDSPIGPRQPYWS